ncbi:hypothetical protein HBF26_14870 [Luteibacter jiangsuensis]|uniref:Phosphatidylinositol diacylglycerol-lyase n=1 Tax=Luteibacter jiangsuensis TaxID=637577 RepID=A0ABX0Q6J7_9GAMM|nr:hypothetical protein [Luteibacter jiangsuensis]NID06174.1 hypothetical protein [Luteibacter jiangsuensis]
MTSNPLIARAMCLLAVAWLADTASAQAPISRDLPFDRYTWVTTHNAFTSNGLAPNQSQTIAQQLEEGVRAFMLDLHYYDKRVRLCHNRCTGPSSVPLADLLNETIRPFLEQHPDAILTLHLDDFTERQQLVAELDRAPFLGDATFDPYSWSTPTWPTYADMVKRGQRVLIFSLNRENSDSLMTRGGAVTLMPSEDFTVENYWSLGTTPLQHDRSCYSRWGESRPLSTAEIEEKPGWPPLFTMNQFHGLPLRSHAYHDNAFDALWDRYTNYCKPATRRKPNYVAVDFHEEGGAHAFVEWLQAQPLDADR